jgi:hypothetical protein
MNGSMIYYQFYQSFSSFTRYSEKKDSNVNRTSVTEHFQTIVRPDMIRLGCGIHVIPGDGTYVTSHYATDSGERLLNDKIENSSPRDPGKNCEWATCSKLDTGNSHFPFGNEKPKRIIDCKFYNKRVIYT